MRVGEELERNKGVEEKRERGGGGNGIIFLKERQATGDTRSS